MEKLRIIKRVQKDWRYYFCTRLKIWKEKPEDLVVAIAEAKANEIISKLGGLSQFVQDPPPTLLITADTVVVYKGVIREKPTSKEEARKFIKGYSGSHEGVVGSVIVRNLKTGVKRGGWDKAEDTTSHTLFLVSL